MADWFQLAIPESPDVALRLADCLVKAAIFGIAVAVIYQRTQRRGRAETGSLVATLVLMTILLAMVTLVIGQNLARAFGLVGVLSIVRFRTVVSDTRDTAFVVFAVVIGMAVGADFVTLAWVSLPVIGGAAWALNLWSGRGAGTTAQLIIRTPVDSDPEALLKPTLAKHLTSSRILAVGTAKQGTAIELTYSVRLRPDASVVALIRELNKVEGIQGVEWKEPSAD
jgi:hypothetical protein